MHLPTPEDLQRITGARVTQVLRWSALDYSIFWAFGVWKPVSKTSKRRSGAAS